MDAPILQITVLKGPKHGDTMACKPGSATRIGRVLKGNHFAVRDPGISQKHLSFHFVPQASRWFLSDLESSNGTVLNGTSIQPLVPVPISDGDVIKVGEVTELGLKIVLQPELLEKDGEGNGVVKGRGVSTRRGALARVSNEEGKGGHTLDPDIVPVAMHKTAQKGKGRGQRKENTESAFKEKIEEDKNVSVQVEEPDQSGGVKLRRNPRRGRALKEVDMNCDASVGIEATGVCIKKKERKGKEIEVLSNEMSNKNNKLVPETENEKRDLKEKAEANGSMAIEEKKGGSGDVGLKEGSEANCGVGVPFEKMTLEQWFDSMEVFLPKVIHDEAEAIINALKEKAKKFEGFVEVGGNV